MRRLLSAMTGALGAGLLAALLPMGTAGAGSASGDAATERISVAADGTQANRASYAPVISRNGRYVAFVSQATNLVRPYTVPPGGQYWSYLRDLRTDTLERVAVDGIPAEVHDFDASENRVVLKSRTGLYVRDLPTGDTRRVDLDLGAFAGGGAYNARISGSGRYVVFEASRPIGSTAAEGSRVYVRDLQDATTQWVSQPNTATDTYYAGGPVISDDGQRIAYTHTRHVSAGAARGNAYLYDRHTGERQMVDVSQNGETPERTVNQLSLNADGSLVLFNRADDSPVTADDQNSNTFIREPAAGTTRPIPPAGNETVTGGGRLSPDGRFALYTAGIGPDAAPRPLFIRNLGTGEVRTVTTTTDGSPVTGDPGRVAITGDNSMVTFSSSAPDLVPGDTNATYDVFVRTLPSDS
ncbi:hypothetical protein GCM10010277_07700 [Streptomyces longisporoflavus]|uniref:TolB family protein n=1 Tax=Streptomyces longisporoflavus TaxID=28044 RepID=UPI00167DEF0F|nr:PD40 domain-containing protein [Streptomyces longisporoflavus]GGV26241.1 hypothetical protein GCM10010277_07700 [Streptomyces longisporoflavus]